jgi:flavin-dependent dehydrogenase
VTHVVVIGGGPAGSTVARRLALAGIPVTQCVSRAADGQEGLSRRTVELLQEEGLDDPADLLAGPAPRTGEWGAGRAVTGEEWLVDRGRLATRLHDAAGRAGARPCDDPVESVDGAYPDFQVRTRGGARLQATCVVDARGRRGTERRGPMLLALGHRFRRAQPLPAATAIHPLSWGWCWIVTTGPALWIQIAGRSGDGHPDEWLARAQRELPVLARVLDGAVSAGEVVARPAHARRSPGPVANGLILAGDAAVALDPLSGQGVYEALRGARVAVAAVRSLLDGTDPRVVTRFLAERDEALWQRCVSTAADFYGENAGLGPFWTGTASAYRALATTPRGCATTIERRPVLDGERICEHDVLVTAAQPRGVWQVSGVPIVSLIHYIERVGEATPGAAAAALSRPEAAVRAAARWLLETGTWPVRASEVTAAGG